MLRMSFVLKFSRWISLFFPGSVITEWRSRSSDSTFKVMGTDHVLFVPRSLEILLSAFVALVRWCIRVHLDLLGLFFPWLVLPMSRCPYRHRYRPAAIV